MYVISDISWLAVSLCEKAAAALEQLKAEAHDLVLSDVYMPGNKSGEWVSKHKLFFCIVYCLVTHMLFPMEILLCTTSCLVPMQLVTIGQRYSSS